MEIVSLLKGTRVRVLSPNVKTPVASPEVKQNDIITMGNLDSMYCNCFDDSGNRVYVAAWTEVELVD